VTSHGWPGQAVEMRPVREAERRKRHESQESFQKAGPLSVCAKDPVSSNRSRFRGFTDDPSVNGQGFGTISTLGSPQAGERACMTRFLLAGTSDRSDQFGVADDFKPRKAIASSTRWRTLSSRYTRPRLSESSLRTNRKSKPGAL